MSFPSLAQLTDVTKKAADAAQPGLAALGVNVGADQIAAVFQLAVDAICMQAWRDVQAAGKAAETTTTLQQAEADEGSPTS